MLDRLIKNQLYFKERQRQKTILPDTSGTLEINDPNATLTQNQSEDQGIPDPYTKLFGRMNPKDIYP